MDLKVKTEELKQHIKNLDIDKFFELYEEIDDPYELPECMVTEIFKHYPEILCGELEVTTNDFDMEGFKKTKNEIIVKMNLFFNGLIEHGFMFNDNILSKRYDEPIHFFKLYEAIGIDQPNSYGNTILHMQIRGLHIEGVKFLLEHDADPNVFNTENKNCFEILFLDNFIAYQNDKSYDKKLEIAKLLIEHNVDFNRVINEKDIFDRTIYNTFVENNGRKNWDIDNLKILKFLLNLNNNRINSAIDNLIVFITENKSIYANEMLFKLDLLNINKLRNELT
jgi:ankyrin repeat protein